MAPKIVEALVLKLKPFRRRCKYEQDFENQQVSSDVQDYLQVHYNSCGAPGWFELVERLYSPQLTIMEGYQQVAKMKNEQVRNRGKIVQVLCLVVTGIIYKLIRKKFQQLQKLQVIFKVFLAAFICCSLDTISCELNNTIEIYKFFEFTMAKTAENQVGTLLKILQKLSYIELRAQDAQANHSDTQRHISCFQSKKGIYRLIFFRFVSYSS